MSYVQLSDGGLPGGLPPWLVVPVLRSCQSPIRIWLVNYLQLHSHLQPGQHGRPCTLGGVSTVTLSLVQPSSRRLTRCRQRYCDRRL